MMMAVSRMSWRSHAVNRLSWEGLALDGVLDTGIQTIGARARSRLRRSIEVTHDGTGWRPAPKRPDSSEWRAAPGLGCPPCMAIPRDCLARLAGATVWRG